jgi:antitoxin ParD1/3/4
MEIHLPPDLQQFIDDQVHRGVFPSANEAVCNAVEHLRERDRLREEVLAKIDQGLAELDRGEGTELDIEWVKAEGRRLLAERQGK